MPVPMKEGTIITIASNKGGAAKTTTAVSLAASLANLEATLLVDGDAQGHIALSFGLPVRSGLFDWLERGLPLQDCTLTGRPKALTILPGDSLTKTVERIYGAKENFDYLVSNLRALSYPFVVLDTAAGGVFQEAALAAADQVVIPFRAEALGIDSMFQTLELLRQLAPTAKVTLLPTAFDRRLSEQRENLQMIINEFGADYGLLSTWDKYVIPTRTVVTQATAYGKTIWEYSGSGVKDVRRGYSALLGRVMGLAGHQPVQELEALNGTGN